MAQEYDVIVLGGGPAGENAADYAIRGSDRTAVVVEGHLVGGECSYYACIPSKAMLRPLDVVATAEQLGGITGELGVDRAGLLARRDEWVSHYDDSSQLRWADGAGIDVVRGWGSLVGEREVEVTDAAGATTRLRARLAVVLATGSTGVVPDELADCAPWSSRDATGVVEVPPRLAVIGGGVVACEAARWMAALGSAVTLLVRGERLLPRAELFAAQAVLEGLRAEGVEVRLGASVSAAQRADADPDGGLGRLHGGVVRLELGDGATLEVEEVLVAAGRRPATGGLGLDSVGLGADDLAGRTHGGPLPEWLYVVGDLNGVAPLTHWGKHQARQVGRVIAARADGQPLPDLTDGPVPQVVFTAPQVAWVGPTVEEARGAGLEVEVREASYTSAAGAALLRDDAAGTARLVVEAGTGRLLGATFVGPEVAELLHAATVAITAGLGLDVLARAVPSYPSASEIWLRLLDDSALRPEA